MEQTKEEEPTIVVNSTAVGSTLLVENDSTNTISSVFMPVLDRSQQINDEVTDEGKVDDDEDDDSKDSDYLCDEESAGESDDEDKVEYMLSLQKELDECADEVRDVYLPQMTAVRDQLQGSEAVWIDRYIQSHVTWKQKYGVSIDETDLDIMADAVTDTVKTISSDKLSWHSHLWSSEDLVLLLCVVSFVIVAIAMQMSVLYHTSERP